MTLVLEKVDRRNIPLIQITSPAMRISRPKLLSRRARNNNEDMKTTEKAGKGSPQRSAQNNQSTSREKLSPLSPTFGPRKGLIPSGTVDRRRSVPHAAAALGFHYCGARDLKAQSTSAIQTYQHTPNPMIISGEVERVLWGPGWPFIEDNGYIGAEKYEEAVEDTTF